MNHQKIYDAIIAKAKYENRIKLRKNQEGYVYYENHHIIPRCLEGTNKKENLIFLNPREHFICHKLLTYIYPNNNKILYAFFMMATLKIKKSIYHVSSRDYEYAKKQIRIILTSKEIIEKRKNTWYNKKYSEKAIDDYISSLSNTHYSPLEDPILHVSFKNKTDYETINKKLKNDIVNLNKTVKSFIIKNH